MYAIIIYIYIFIFTDVRYECLATKKLRRTLGIIIFNE